MPLWTPSHARQEKSRLNDFMKRQGRESYEELYRWSVREPAAFWAEIWRYCGVIGGMGGTVLADGDRLPGARWFPEARLNYAENLLRRRDEAPALILRREDGLSRQLSFADLAGETARLQRAFRAAGLEPGDRVAAFTPNCPEAICCLLAVSSLGGIWSSASPDFGVQGVLDRFGQIAPRFLIAADGYFHKGTRYPVAGKLPAILAGLPSVEHCIVIPYIGEDTGVGDAVDYHDFKGGAPAGPIDFPRFPFEHPLYILYSSGTTGAPKCIVHGAGGVLLQHLKEHQLHTDIGPEDRFFYFTTTGWMMWNWLVSGLASGATLILYDGNPFHPRPEALWDMAQEEGVTVFGTSAKYLDACKKAGLAPARTHDLSRLRAILSTGSPLVPESFDYVYQEIKSDLQLSSISGGTDICSCFVLGCPILPVHRGEIQCRGLGMNVQIFDAEGQAVVGEAGELVCTAPAPAMPTGFWQDGDGSRYRAAYFEHYPGVWRHGDLAEINARGGIVIYGRSDATLNPGGVRIGTAEIYRQVEQVPEIEEAVVIGQEVGGDQRIILFVKLVSGAVLDEPLREQIRRRLAEQASRRHVPAFILAVPDIPRTRSGKISEIAVREILHGRALGNREALANPEALEHFRDRPELRLP